MLTGRVNSLQTRLTVEVLDSNGQPHPVEVVLDTGVDGELALTASVIQRLNLARGIPASPNSPLAA